VFGVWGLVLGGVLGVVVFYGVVVWFGWRPKSFPGAPQEKNPSPEKLTRGNWGGEVTQNWVVSEIFTCKLGREDAGSQRKVRCPRGNGKRGSQRKMFKLPEEH